MFGATLVEKGYDQAAEWLEIVEKLYASDQAFDHHGTYYHLETRSADPPASSSLVR
jgi:alkanesulfonate monooxygenase SsuD/methylene tetrahydromethanopterin reductase-like flavin-dependent oxidoreductase (luciferase family)